MSKKFSQVFSAMLARERRAVGVVALIAVCRMFGLFALLPVLAIYAADLESATPTLIGLAVGGYGLTQAFLQVPFGMASDRWGRKPVIVVGMLLFAAGSFIAGATDDIHWILVGRVIQGDGKAVAMHPVGDIAADQTKGLHPPDAKGPQHGVEIVHVYGIAVGLHAILVR